MKIVLLEEAQSRFRSEDGWWRENRDAKDLFVEEFTETLREISAMPEIGRRYRHAGGKLIPRVLMKKTRCHVYYFQDHDRALIEVHSVWGARKRRGPKL